MSILTELSTLLEGLNVPFETGHFNGEAPDEYMVIVPLSDTLENFVDNLPTNDVQEVRLSIFTRNNYIKLRNQLTKYLLESDFTVTDRRYIGFEADTKVHHYVIEVLKNYEFEMEE
jgi:hypothetical protein